MGGWPTLLFFDVQSTTRRVCPTLRDFRRVGDTKLQTAKWHEYFSELLSRGQSKPARLLRKRKTGSCSSATVQVQGPIRAVQDCDEYSAVSPPSSFHSKSGNHRSASAIRVRYQTCPKDVPAARRLASATHAGFVWQIAASGPA